MNTRMKFLLSTRPYTLACLLIVMLCSQLFTGLALAADNASESGRRLWNLQNADIRTVIEQVSKETKKNFVIDEKVHGKVTIVSSTPINSEQVYEVFLQALQVLGYAAIPSGDVIKIVQDSSARSMGLPLAGTSDEQDMVVQVIPVKYVSAPALVPILRPLMSPQGGHLGAYGNSNMLIAADHKPAVERLVQIVKRVDVADSDGIEIIQLHHAMASEVGEILNNLMSAKRVNELPSQQISVSADDRSNSIVLSGDKTRRLKIRAVIANLDIAAPSEGNTEVIYIKYQKAEDLVPVLSNVIQSYYGASKAGQAMSNGGSGKRPSIMAALSSMSRGGGSSKSSSSSSKGGESDIQAEAREGVGTVIGGFGVQADPNLNALIITAPPTLMRNVKKVISQLDVRRRQVLVEAIIVELSEDSTSQMGINWYIADGNYRGGFISDTDNTLLKGMGDAASTKIAGMSLGFIKGSSVRAILSALESEGGTNVLATPSLIAMDNTKARIFVGETLPRATQNRTPASDTSANPDDNYVYQSIEQKEVGLGLNIVPQITVDNAVQLTINQWADSDKAIATSGDGKSNVLLNGTTNRSIDTTVLVNDGDIVVLGGLIRTNKLKTNTKVPLLGDIPALGNLFKYKNETTQKTNMMVFIRPVILRDRDASVLVSGAKYKNMRDKMLADNPFGNDANNMPEYEKAMKANIPEPPFA